MIKRLILLVIVILIPACTPQTDTPTSVPPSQGATTIVTSTSDSGPGSLRQALLDAQSYDTITFDPTIFQPDAPATIMVMTELPHIQQSNLTLDASNAGVILDGSQVTGEWIAGLQIVSSEANTIMGLQISHFPGPGIAISGAAKHNVIGGDRSLGAGPFGQGNLLINNVIGIDLSTNGTTLNTIIGNLIGTDNADTPGLGNLRSGVSISEGAHNNLIGSNNIIAYNNGCGVEINDAASSGNTLSQNSIYGNGENEACLEEDDNMAIATPCPGCTSEPLPEYQANTIFYNGVILTMENGATASAIAVKDEYILDVGSDEDMLAYAGPGTTLIDLEGRTLMPGFVDGHSHWFNNVWREDFESGQQLLLSYGITTSAEAFVEEPLVKDMQAFDREGKLRMRISLYLLHVDNCGEIRGDWYWPNYPVSREPGAMLQIPGIKLFNDGGSCNRPAFSFEYDDGGQGDLYFQVDELAGMIIEAQNRGYQVAIHGLGDWAIEVILDAIEVALAGGPNSYRHRIEHNTMVRDDMLLRYTEVGPVAMIFGFDLTCRRNNGDFSKPEQYQEWEWRYRSLIDENPEVHFAWHSDAGATVFGSPPPMMHIYGFATRRQIMDDGTICEPQDWAANDVITVEEALRIMTIEGAYALWRDDEIGSLKAGKLADLIILSDDPLDVDLDSIPDIQVIMTMVGGSIEYCAAGNPGFCP